VSDRQQRLGRLDLRIESGAQHSLRIRKGLHDVDDEKGRTFSESHFQAEELGDDDRADKSRISRFSPNTSVCPHG
jgi:hypothetical protein